MQPTISKNKLFSMVMIGCILETYDYALYGYFAPILSRQFFPQLTRGESLLMTFAVFAAGFLMRPLGGAILGNYGDQFGRKKTLLCSIMMMALSTALIGALPVYAKIGAISGVLLMCCRLLQGFSVGAELVGTMIYLIEFAPSNKKSRYGALSIVSGFMAALFASALVWICLHIFSHATLNAWGWRIPFLLSIILGVFGLIIRLQLPETPDFASIKKEKNDFSFLPLRQVLRDMPLTLLQATGVVVMHILGFYLIFVYLSSYLSSVDHLSMATCSVINTIALCISIFLILWVGKLGDRMQPKNVIAISCIGFILFSYPLFCLFHTHSIFLILIAQMGLSFLLCFSASMTPAYLTDLFPPHLRYTGMAIAYNVSAILFGGLTPLLLTYLSDKAFGSDAPVLCLILAAVITLSSLFLIRKKDIEILMEPA